MVDDLERVGVGIQPVGVEKHRPAVGGVRGGESLDVGLGRGRVERRGEVCVGRAARAEEGDAGA